MRVDGTDIPKSPLGLGPEARKPANPDEAAKQFEEVLVKQMLHTMTKEIFDSNLTGDDAPQWMGAYSDMQGDILTEELAKQISKNGRMGIAELLLKQWKREGEIPGGPESEENDRAIRDAGPLNPYTEV